jgi:hypothetical protein
VRALEATSILRFGVIGPTAIRKGFGAVGAFSGIRSNTFERRTFAETTLIAQQTSQGRGRPDVYRPIHSPR